MTALNIQPSGFIEKITEARFLKSGDKFRFNSEPDNAGCVIFHKGEKVIIDIDLCKPEFERMNEECTVFIDPSDLSDDDKMNLCAICTIEMMINDIDNEFPEKMTDERLIKFINYESSQLYFTEENRNKMKKLLPLTKQTRDDLKSILDDEIERRLNNPQYGINDEY